MKKNIITLCTLFEKNLCLNFFGKVSGEIHRDMILKLSLVHYSFSNADEFSFDKNFNGWISSLEKSELSNILKENGYEISFVN